MRACAMSALLLLGVGGENDGKVGPAQRAAVDQDRALRDAIGCALLPAFECECSVEGGANAHRLTHLLLRCEHLDGVAKESPDRTLLADVRSPQAGLARPDGLDVTRLEPGTLDRNRHRSLDPVSAGIEPSDTFRVRSNPESSD